MRCCQPNELHVNIEFFMRSKDNVARYLDRILQMPKAFVRGNMLEFPTIVCSNPKLDRVVYTILEMNRFFNRSLPRRVSNTLESYTHKTYSHQQLDCVKRCPDEHGHMHPNVPKLCANELIPSNANFLPKSNF